MDTNFPRESFFKSKQKHGKLEYPCLLFPTSLKKLWTVPPQWIEAEVNRCLLEENTVFLKFYKLHKKFRVHKMRTSLTQLYSLPIN